MSWTKEEIEAIEEYTSHDGRKRHQKIKMVIAKNYENLSKNEKYFVKYAKTIKNMFKKYDSSFDKNQPIFRGLSLKITEFEQYKNLKIDDIIILDKSFMSFSKEIEIAFDFVDIENKNSYSLLIIAENRYSKELDLSKYSNFEEEKEILIQNNIKWKIIDLIFPNEKTLYLKVKEV